MNNITQLRDHQEQRRTLEARDDYDGRGLTPLRRPRMPQPIYTSNGIFARFCRWVAGFNARRGA